MIFWCRFASRARFCSWYLVLAEIHDPADRRDRGGRDLHQVQTLLPCDRDGLRRRHDAELLPGVVDDADLADANPLVHPGPIVASAGTFESDNSLPQLWASEAVPG